MSKKVKISDGEVAYIGDDAVDISLLKKVGLPVAVADATKDTKAEARLITKKAVEERWSGKSANSY
ncbi:HAD hydrolase family protein [Thermodesulfovibrionales bacterium]|nr:HAD hydrolase family protein [Thermodesulfovibrionales bacterium]